MKIKKICLTCKYAEFYDSYYMSCLQNCLPLAKKYDCRCKLYKKNTNKNLIKILGSFYECEPSVYDEYNDFIYSVEFDKDEGFVVTIPIVVGGTRKIKKSDIYYDEFEANFLVRKLNNLIEVKK
ncbi:MAG: hypothetical protein ACRC5T_06375 [Cetobacterium sp.]